VDPPEQVAQLLVQGLHWLLLATVPVGQLVRHVVP